MHARLLVRLSALVVGRSIWVVAMAQAAVGTAITYQGQLKDAGMPGSRTADFTFELKDAKASGAILGSRDLTSVEVVDARIGEGLRPDTRGGVSSPRGSRLSPAAVRPNIFCWD